MRPFYKLFFSNESLLTNLFDSNNFIYQIMQIDKVIAENRQDQKNSGDHQKISTYPQFPLNGTCGV